MSSTIKKLEKTTLLFSLTLISSLLPWSIIQRDITSAQAQSGQVLPAGNDFATSVLQDPWDMAEFSDISTYLNRSGQASLLENISTENGVFSAKATNLRQATFFPLFPGYENALLVGKVGNKYPIDANKYKCLYVAAKVDSGPPQNGVPDQMIVYWFADEKLNLGTWGQTLPGIFLYPEANSGTPSPRWKLYSVRLDQAKIPSGMTPWNQAPNGIWKGLRIDATLQQTGFQFDWVRLTDCNAVPLQISWPGFGDVSVIITPVGTGREILAVQKTSQNPILLDTQGLPPGKYSYSVIGAGGEIAHDSFEIGQTPIISFDRPSFFSGPDYATLAGDSWDMSNAADVVSSQCMEAQIKDGLLFMDTVSTEHQPSNCHGGDMNASDPGVFLNTPQPVDPREYRFLTFRMHTDGPWENIPEGMIGRWVWYVQGTSGLPANRCILVSHPIPYNVGWQSVAIDLHDAWEGGIADSSVVECPNASTWLESTPALEVRFDPNENITGETLHQKLDWIRLTGVDEVVRGTQFPIILNLNMDWSLLKELSLYYTTDPDDAFQNKIVQSQSSSYQPTASYPNKIFLPMSLKTFSTSLSFDGKPYYWDTSSVSPDLYYICAKAATQTNSATYCSEAPVAVR